MVAFFVKYDDSVPAYMDSVYNYIHFASIWYDFPDYEDNSLFIPTRAISDSREIYHLVGLLSLGSPGDMLGSLKLMCNEIPPKYVQNTSKMRKNAPL